MIRNELVYVRGDDWVGVYVNNKLITEGHSIEPEDFGQIVIDENITNITTKWVDLEWLDEMSHFPEDLSKVKFE